MRLSRSGTGEQKCLDAEDISAPLARFSRVCSQMGYGSRALQLLQMYYEGRFPCLEEKVLETSREIHTVSSEVSVFWPGSQFLAETGFPLWVFRIILKSSLVVWAILGHSS